MHSEPRHDYGGAKLEEVSKQKLPETMGRHFLLLASAAQFALFVPLAWWARKHPHPLVELEVTHLVQQKHATWLRSTITALSTLTGSAVLLNILVVPAAAILWRRRLRLEAIMTVGISWTCALVRTGIQWVVDRPRPNPLLVRISHDKKTKSFPSGHVSSSVVFWGWLVALGIQLRSEMPGWQRAVVGIPVLFVTVVGPSRVYLGDHWTTDALAGYLFGGGWLGLSLWLYLELRNRNGLARSGSCQVSKHQTNRREV